MHPLYFHYISVDIRNVFFGTIGNLAREMKKTTPRHFVWVRQGIKSRSRCIPLMGSLSRLVGASLGKAGRSVF